jgi:hypothetical protein
VSDHVRSVDESALGAADLDSLTDNERGNECGCRRPGRQERQGPP